MDKNRERESNYQEEEIDLYELYLILKRRWKLLVLIPSVLTLIAVIYAYVIAEPKYEAYSLYPLNEIYKSERGETSYISKGKSLKPISFYEFYENITKMIESTLKQLAPPELAKGISVSQKGMFLKLGYLHGNLGETKKALSKLDKLINKVVKDFTVEPYKEEIEEQIKALSSSIKKLEIEIEKKEKEIEDLENSEKTQLNQKILKLKSSKKALLQRIDELEKERTLLSKKLEEMKASLRDVETKIKDLAQKQNKDLALVELYKERNRLKEELLETERAMLSKKAMIKEIKTQLNVLDYRLKKEIPAESKKLENSIDKIKLSVELLNLEKDLLSNKLNSFKNLIENERVIEPVVFAKSSEKPVKPKRELIVAVSFVSSLILAVFIILFIEWFNSAKRRHLEA